MLKREKISKILKIWMEITIICKAWAMVLEALIPVVLNLIADQPLIQGIQNGKQNRVIHLLLLVTNPSISYNRESIWRGNKRKLKERNKRKWKSKWWLRFSKRKRSGRLLTIQMQLKWKKISKRRRNKLKNKLRS